MRMIILFTSLLLALPAQASECKGLSDIGCSGNKLCRWHLAYKVGEVSKASGKAYKTDRKAFCRKG